MGTSVAKGPLQRLSSTTSVRQDTIARLVLLTLLVLSSHVKVASSVQKVQDKCFEDVQRAPSLRRLRQAWMTAPLT